MGLHHGALTFLLAVLLVLALISATLVYTGEAAGYPARCFISIQKSKSGVWWFVDPLGKPFLSLGVNTVTYWGVPASDGTIPYRTAVQAKYNNDQQAWANATIARLRSWNFNTIGAWSDSVIVTKGMPYAVNLELAKGFNNKFVGGLFPDPFDPAWEAQVLDKTRSLCAPISNDPYLLGYYIDNEIWWGPVGGMDDPRHPGTALDQMLINLNSTAPGNVRAKSFIKSRYSTIELLNKAWNTSFTSFDNIKTFPNKTTAHTTDSSDFDVTRNAIKKYDPYHLIMGTRFAGNIPVRQVLQAFGEYCDVASLNYYPLSTARSGPSRSMLTGLYNITKKPWLISEFSYRGKDSGLPNTKGSVLVVNTQAERGSGHKNYTTNLAPLPGVVGFHWFQWFDQPKVGRQGDLENSNYGLVDNNDAPWTAMVSQMTATNSLLANLHEASPTGFTAKCFSALSCPNDCSGHGCCNTATGECTCDTGFAQLQVKSFGSQLDTDVWQSKTGGWSNQHFLANMSSTSSGQLKLSVRPCPTCPQYDFAAGGVVTRSKLFGFGVYSAIIKTPTRTGFKMQFELSSEVSPRDVITMHIASNQSSMNLDYYSDSVYRFLRNVSPLPFANPSTGFHNYTIRYLPSSFAFFADGVLLAEYNSTTASAGLPNATMAVALYLTATTSSPVVSDAAFVSSVTYKQVGGTKATCRTSTLDDSTNDEGEDTKSAASSLMPSLFRWLRTSP